MRLWLGEDQFAYGLMSLQMTVKKTLSDFRRTHHDNWHDHKQMFTDDQLVVLTDLLISPNYYAWPKFIT